MQNNEELELYGCQIKLDSETFCRLLGIEGVLSNAQFNPQTGNLSLAFVGGDDKFPPIDPITFIPEVCDVNYLSVIIPNRIVRLVDQEGLIYTHRTYAEDWPVQDGEEVCMLSDLITPCEEEVGKNE